MRSSVNAAVLLIALSGWSVLPSLTQAKLQLRISAELAPESSCTAGPLSYWPQLTSQAIIRNRAPDTAMRAVETMLVSVSSTVRPRSWTPAAVTVNKFADAPPVRENLAFSPQATIATLLLMVT